MTCAARSLSLSLSPCQDDNDAVVTSALRVLAGASAGVREAPAGLQKGFRPVLSALCVQGTRRQAKLAVQAMLALSAAKGAKAEEKGRKSTPTDGPLSAVRNGHASDKAALRGFVLRPTERVVCALLQRCFLRGVSVFKAFLRFSFCWSPALSVRPQLFNELVDQIDDYEDDQLARAAPLCATKKP